ncbi:hypothetical protein MPHLCCUG_02448 [Mycolicibacterium phlei]|uniref:DUF7159 family protein n=1 Tax=Mycolicibacterium phlei TaxID=1771 RepID=UPI00078DF562|nr:hypothetical protein [Mycolicibacterium phlei]AMO61260.1 hypothetical protein MPHLCCUG_02448 [Mycolicibacterium phlei]
MDAVLGMSVTSSAVGLVLVEGQDADGGTVDRNAIYPRRRSTPQQIADEAAAAVLRSETLAAAQGHRLRTIGVTWSDDADAAATLLLRALTDCGFDSVVPVRMPEASEALAWGVADVIGCDVTAVCVVESGTIIALVVNTAEGAVLTAVNQSIVSEEGLVRWLGAVFARADWRPEALVLVGSGSGLDALMPRLEDVLAVPVFSPAEAEFAMARGAALAAAHSGTPPAPGPDAHVFPPARHRTRQPALAAPLAMLTAGTVTFVASVSAAISLQLAPGRDTTLPEPAPAAKSSPDVAAAAPRPAAAPPRAVVAEPPPEVVMPADPPEAPPVEEIAEEAVDPVPELGADLLAPPELPPPAEPGLTPRVCRRKPCRPVRCPPSPRPRSGVDCCSASGTGCPTWDPIRRRHPPSTRRSCRRLIRRWHLHPIRCPPPPRRHPRRRPRRYPTRRRRTRSSRRRRTSR